MEKYRFNVFGRIIAIERAQAQWRCFNVGADGKRAPALLAIPCDVTHAELAQNAGDVLGIDLLAPLPSLPAEAAGTAAELRAGETELVVLSALGLVAEQVIGFLHFLELRLGLFVAGIAVGMMLPGESAIRLLDVRVGTRLGDAEHFVGIAWHGRRSTN